MGLTWDSAYMIAKSVKDGAMDTDAVLSFGRSDVLFSVEGWAKIINMLGLGKINGTEISIYSEKTQAKLKEMIDSGTFLGERTISMEGFFTSIGFERVDSLDVSDYEGANIIHDLNKIIDDQSLYNKYSFVHDAGTMEHVFNVLNVLENVYRLLKTGGVVVHENPMNGWVDHGFYQFSPTFYTDYYASNNFEVLNSMMYWSEIGGLPGDFFWQKYIPGAFDTLFRGDPRPAEAIQLRNGKHNLHNNFFMARKTEASTFGAIPTQGYCQRDGSWNT